MKILAMATAGGHFLQLLRLRPAFDTHEVIYISSKENFGVLVPENQFHFVPGASRANKIKLITGFFKVLKIVFKTRPDVIITTGAALGVMGICAGKIFGAKTIWIDSIANALELSMSGRIASKIASRTYTQWNDLASKKIIYSGNVLK